VLRGNALESHDEITRPRAASWAPSEQLQDRTVYFEQKATAITFTPEMYASRAKAVAAKGLHRAEV
jgi:hypothetical protein